MVVTGTSAANIVTAADATGFDVPAWSARPANVPAGGAAGVVGVVGETVRSELQAVVEDDGQNQDRKKLCKAFRKT